MEQGPRQRSVQRAMTKHLRERLQKNQKPGVAPSAKPQRKKPCDSFCCDQVAFLETPIMGRTEHLSPSSSWNRRS
eukprot:6385315-Amphidinium_carterae.1